VARRKSEVGKRKIGQENDGKTGHARGRTNCFGGFLLEGLLKRLLGLRAFGKGCRPGGVRKVMVRGADISRHLKGGEGGIIYEWAHLSGSLKLKGPPMGQGFKNSWSRQGTSMQN